MSDLYEKFGQLTFTSTEKATKIEDEDLQEHQIWDLMMSQTNKNSPGSDSSSGSSPPANAWQFPGNSRAMPRGGATAKGVVRHRSSAPMDIPDWSKILQKNTRAKQLWDDSYNDDQYNDGYGKNNMAHDVVSSDDDEDEMVPPHEYLAKKKSARSHGQNASFSSCEGRLRGRELNNLRNAILSKTGFLE